MKTRLKLAYLVLLLAVLFAGGWLGIRKLHHRQEMRLVDTAAAFLARGDFRSASLTAQQALGINPSSIEACGLMVNITEMLHSPEAVLWRQKLAGLKPGDVASLLALATTATKFGETFIAGEALARIAEQHRNTVVFFRAKAEWAVATRQYPLAEQCFERALELDPKNESIQLNLATLRILSNDPEVAAGARAALEKLRANPALNQAALRALLTDARLRKDLKRSKELAEELNQGAKVSLEDRLLYLEELQHADDPAFEEALRVLRSKVGDAPGAILVLMTWMNGHGLASETVAWGKALAPGLRSEMPVPLGLAEAYVILGEWETLRPFVAKGNWGALDFLRLAIYARALDELSEHRRGPDFKDRWERAIIVTHGDINAQSMLARLVMGWGWKEEAAQVWWLIARHDVGQRPALQALYRIYSETKNTPQLYRVARRIYQVEPGNPVAKNNVAMLALLLRQDLSEAHRLAGENYRQHSTTPATVSTWAFSLHLRGRDAEAIRLLSDLPDAELHQPSMAACYGVVLANSGDREKAGFFLKLALGNKDQLFPEEVALVQDSLREHP